MTPAKGYTEMKDSGIEWISEIPAHWGILRGKNVLRLLERPVKPDDDVITCFRDGEVTLRKNRREEGFTNSLKEIGYQGVEPGDLIVHGMDGFAGSIGISDSRGKASPVLNVMDSNQNKRYLMYYLRAMAYKDVFMALSTGIRVRSCDLRWNKLSVFPFLIPTSHEQSAIAAYLDTQCAKIDEIIARAKASIEDYKQWKASIIYKAVTKGLDPNVEMKDSGIPWIGKVPTHWRVTKIKNFVSIRSGITLGKQYPPGTQLVSRPYLRVANVRYEHGPYDPQLQSFETILSSNGWYIALQGSPVTYQKGKRFEEGLKEYMNTYSDIDSKLKKIVDFLRPMKTSQAERVATLLAAWNDYILDGIPHPSDKEIIDEVVTHWTPNKANPQYSTWQDTLCKMRENQFIPKGSGVHTLQKEA